MSPHASTVAEQVLKSVNSLWVPQMDGAEGAKLYEAIHHLVWCT